MNKSFAVRTVFSLMIVVVLFSGLPKAMGEDQAMEGAGTVSSPLYMLTYDHGGLILWGHDHFLEKLRSAKQWLDRYPGFKIGLDNEAYTYDQLAKDHPEVLKEIRKYLVDYKGRFGIATCTYGQPLSVFVNEESNIRQISYALEAVRKHLGCAPDVYLMSEHAMHSQIPQILKGFGFTGAIMRTHFMMYGYNPTFDAAIGWWKGLDGSRIPTIPTYKGEGAQFGRTTVDNWFLTRYPGSNAPESPADFRKKFARIQPLLATRADDAGLRREELVREYEGKPGYQWILLEEISSLFPTPEKELKTLANDFVVRMPWGYCGNEIWNQCRAAEVAVLTAERLAAIDLLYKGRNRQGALDEAWKQLLVAQHHDVQICGLLKDARRFLPKSIEISNSVIDSCLQHLASQMSGGKAQQVVIFNPVSWSRKEWVEVPVLLPRGYAKDLQVRCGDTIVPAVILSADLHSNGSLRDINLALKPELPGLSLTSCALVPGKKKPVVSRSRFMIDPEKLTVVSPYLKVRLDAQGGIAELVDARTGRDLIQKGKRSSFFAGVINGQPVTSRGQLVLEQAPDGADWAVANETGFIGNIPYLIEMRFYADTPRIDCRVRFSFDGQRMGRLSEDKRDSRSPFIHEEKLRFKMFPKIGNDAIGVRDLPFAVSETSDRYVNGLYWTATTDNKNGIAFFNRGTMGAVREKDGGFSMPLAYAMYYIWGTRMLTGDFVYEFAIYPFTGPWQKADLHKRAIEYNFQPVGLHAEAGNGVVAQTLHPFALDSEQAVVSALYNKGEDIFIRLYDDKGKRRKVSLQYRMGQADMTEVDLNGRRLRTLSGQLDIEPWQIKTVRIEPLGK